MKFTSTLIKGKLIKRYKRFFADIKVNNSVLTAHCPNTGSMMGLLNQGNDVWITKNDNPNRKLKFTLEMIKVNKSLVGVNTHRANRIVEHGLKNKLFKEFNHVEIVLVLISFVLPDKTSLPIIIIPAFISFLFVIYKYK